MRRTTVTIATSLAVLASLGCFAALRKVYRVQPDDTLHDALFVSSPRAVKRLSLGYSGLMADIYWTRVVQYFGRKHHANSEEYRALAPLLDITVTLDPQLLAAYQFGSIFLAAKPPDGAGDIDAAVALIKRGIDSNPKNWSLYYSLGYLQYQEKHDFNAAAEAFDQGSMQPGAHDWMKTMAAQMRAKAGDTRTARYMWSRIYEETDDRNIKQNALMRLGSLQVDEEVPQLEKVLAEYQQKTGGWPASWQELVRAGVLERIPVDPSGVVYVLRPEGKVRPADPKTFRYSRYGLSSPV